MPELHLSLLLLHQQMLLTGSVLPVHPTFETETVVDACYIPAGMERDGMERESNTEDAFCVAGTDPASLVIQVSGLYTRLQYLPLAQPM